jgi:hypothetical protein
MIAKLRIAKNRLFRRLKWSTTDFESYIEEIVKENKKKKPSLAELRRREILALYGLMDVIEMRLNNLTAELLKTGDETWH